MVEQADEQGNKDERGQVHERAAAGDCDGVARRLEEVVQRQAACHGRYERWPEASICTGHAYGPEKQQGWHAVASVQRIESERETECGEARQDGNKVGTKAGRCELQPET